MKSISLISVLFLALSLQAAIPQKKHPAPNAILRGPGAIHGGVAAQGFSVLGLRNFPGKNGKIERLTIDIGNRASQLHAGVPGHFHIENSPSNKRIVIELSQTVSSKVNESQLKKIFQKSPLIASSEMFVDPQSLTTSLVINLKKPVSVRAIPVAGNARRTAQLNIDIFDDSLLKNQRR